MPTMAREAWTDERLDDLSKTMDTGFREVKDEIRSTRAELKAEIGELRVGLEKLGDRIDRLSYTLIAGLIGLLATHYLG
jgi:hypothetical protein